MVRKESEMDRGRERAESTVVVSDNKYNTHKNTDRSNTLCLIIVRRLYCVRVCVCYHLLFLSFRNFSLDTSMAFNLKRNVNKIICVFFFFFKNNLLE